MTDEREYLNGGKLPLLEADQDRNGLARVEAIPEIENARSLGGDPARVIVGGDSAGGNLAAGCAQRVPGIAGQLLVYPFFEYYRDGDSKYMPLDLGAGTDVVHRGRYRAHEELLYVGYGINDRLAVELEAATHISASLVKSAGDQSPLPGRIHESGLGDVATRLRWRWNGATAARPEFFSAVEIGWPFQRSRRLIGRQELELMVHTGVIRAFSFGTLSARGGLLSVGGVLEPAEFQFEYLKRLSPRLRVYGGLEGVSDEWAGVTELQVFLTPAVVLKLNNAFGLTSKAIGWAPEVGVTFSFGRREAALESRTAARN